jgi:GMP synthase (glutamine-hydrolysing)
VAGLCTRIEVYKHAGYFAPDQADEIKAQARRSNVTWPPVILRRFVQRYAHGGLADGDPGRSSLARHS